MRLTALLLLALAATAQTPDPHSVPTLDAAIGPCSADLTVTDKSAKPVYNATIKVHIAYRFGGFHKMDLQLSTNIDGKARFTGLPDRTKRGLTFRASSNDLAGEGFLDPSNNCKAQLTLSLQAGDSRGGR